MRSLSIIIFLLISIHALAQSPSGMNYQAVARDGNDDLVVNQSISIRISIIQGSTFGASVYVETHNPTTNDNGLFSLIVGQGSVNFGTFSNINWGSGAYFMKSELDLNGGSNYLNYGITQFLSVPYALYSDSTGNVNDADSDPINELNQGVSLTGTLLSISDAGGTLTQDLSSIQDGFVDADADSTNELNLGISLTGTLLSIEDAGGTITQDLSSVVQWDTLGTSIYNLNQGNVGIGTSMINAKLHIKVDSVYPGILIKQGGGLPGLAIDMSDTLTYEPAVQVNHNGFGSPFQANITNNLNPFAGYYLNHMGIGSGLFIKNTPKYPDSVSTQYSPLLNLFQNGSGQFGKGIAMRMGPTTTGTGIWLRHEGSDSVRLYYGWPSRGLEVDIIDTNNYANGLSVFSYGKGIGQYIRMYKDNWGALGIRQEGTGNGIFINLDDTSSFSNSININHKAKGNAIEVVTFGPGSPIRGINVNPFSVTSAAIVGIASNGNDGVGVEGAGGRYGIHAIATNSNTNTYGVYAQGDLAATGVKSFVVDHPTDPTNKVLRHYSVESNEVLNMYRGIAKFDSLGFCKIELPNYWDAANTNPSYQLTAIGTPEQPYIYKEIVDNYFIISGKPFTKVSWTVYSNRNDPTFRYYDSHGKNYSNEEFDKLDSEKGSYYVPEAFGKPSLFTMPQPKEFYLDEHPSNLGDGEK